MKQHIFLFVCLVALTTTTFGQQAPPSGCTGCRRNQRCIFGRCLRRNSCVGIVCNRPGTFCRSGRCRARRPRICSFRLCSRFGAREPCNIVLPFSLRNREFRQRLITCRRWATISRLRCTRFARRSCRCSRRRLRVFFDNTNRRYCNRCRFARASCRSQFRIYGPFRRSFCSRVYYRGCTGRPGACRCRFNRRQCARYGANFFFRRRRCIRRIVLPSPVARPLDW